MPMLSDVYVLKTLHFGTLTLCAATFCNITSSDVYVYVYVAMGCEQHNKITDHDLELRRCGMWATCRAMSQWAVISIKKLRIMILYSVGAVCGQHAGQ